MFRVKIKRKTPIGDGNCKGSNFIVYPLSKIKRKTPIGDGNFTPLPLKNDFEKDKKKDPDRGRKACILAGRQLT